MMAAFRSGMGSLVDQWFGRSRARKAPRLNEDRQGSRTQPRAAGSAEGSPWLGAHAGVAMRRFIAHALDANLGDLKDEATPRDLAALEPAARVLGDLELQAKFLPRRPALLPR